jgi:hypothetical protein
MIRTLFICTLLTAVIALPGNPQSSPSKPVKTTVASASIPATQPVLTIDGACNKPRTVPHAGAGNNPCKTVITRQEFDHLRDALNPFQLPEAPGARRNLAEKYLEMAAYAQAATDAGLANDPKFAALMKYVRVTTLAQLYRQQLDYKYRNPSPQEIEAYYKQNPREFEEIEVIGISVPKKDPTGKNKDDFEKKAGQVMNDIRERAAKGEDFEKLQHDAYTALGLTTAPGVIMGVRMRSAFLPQEADELFSLPADQVSKVENEATDFAIYKTKNKQMLPLDKVKTDVMRALWNRKTEEQARSVQSSVHANLNEQYFGPPDSSAKK